MKTKSLQAPTLPVTRAKMKRKQWTMSFVQLSSPVEIILEVDSGSLTAVLQALSELAVIVQNIRQSANSDSELDILELTFGNHSHLVADYYGFTPLCI